MIDLHLSSYSLSRYILSINTVVGAVDAGSKAVNKTEEASGLTELAFLQIHICETRVKVQRKEGQFFR